MNMFKKGTVLVLILLVILVTPLLVSCEKNTNDASSITISNKDIATFYDVQKSEYALAITTVDKAYYYFITVYPMGDMTHCVYNTTLVKEDKEVLTCVFGEDVIKWKELDVYIIAYSQDHLAASNILRYTVSCIVEDPEIYDADEPEAGSIDGYDDPGYYYAVLQNKIDIIETNEDIKYAILVSNASDIVDFEMPYMYADCYEIDTDLNAIVINRDCINSFALGAFIPMTITYSDDSKYEFNIELVDTLTPQLDRVSIERGYSSDVTFNCLKESSSWTIERVVLDGKILSVDYYGNTQKSVSLHASYLKTLSLGDHVVRIYYKDNGKIQGYSETIICIEASSITKAPYNLKLTYDNTYPEIKLTYDVDYDYEEAIVYVNDIAKISSINNSKLFASNSAMVTGYVSSKSDKVEVYVRYKDGSTYRSQATYLDENMYEHTKRVTFFTDKVSYLGKTVNRFITSEQELYDFVGYHINHYGDSDTFRESPNAYEETYQLYSPYLATKYPNSEKATKIILSAYEEYVEPLSLILKDVSVSNNIITFTVRLTSGSCRPYTTYHAYTGTSDYIEYPNSELHYYTHNESQRSDNFEGFKVNDIATTAEVTTSVELMLALEAGLKPEPVYGSAAANIYNLAKGVLREIIDDRMSDYEKVLAIYDWLSYNVIFDRGFDSIIASTKPTTDYYKSFFKNTSFYAEGVFIYHVALCNGIASAFSILANIEGIPTVKAMGKVNSGSHSWVKVYVNGEWYICDSTWSNSIDKDTSTQKYEYINYDYFMLSFDEAKLRSRTEHEYLEGYKYFAGDTTFDYYSTEYFIYNGALYTKYVTTKAEFEAVIKHYMESLGVHQIVQLSIRTTKTLAELQTWLDEMVDAGQIDIDILVTLFNRKDVNNSLIEDYLDVAYIRVDRA